MTGEATLAIVRSSMNDHVKIPAKSRNPSYPGPVSDQVDGEHFFNPGRRWKKSPGDLLRWMMERKPERWPASHPSPYMDAPPHRVPGRDIRLSYVGHASFLLQTGGLNILIDPVWSERVSPLRFVGPKRVNPPGIPFEKLPPIDVVLVSHNHYDHLDIATLRRLHAVHAPRIVTPLGNDTIIRDAHAGIRAEAHDWGARVELGPNIAVHFEEAYHWSARGLFDRRMALWAAFVIETPSGAIYHIADTGFGDGELFRAARRKYGGFKLAILPIGAYEPRWFMKDQHVDPAEAVKIFELCGARQAMGHHWGTFQLTNEEIDAPPKALATALKKGGHAETRFRVFRPGEVFDVKSVV